MAITKTLRTIVAEDTINAAAGATTGSVLDLTTKYGGVLTARITNDVIAPSVPCSVFVEISGDNINWVLLHQASARQTPSEIYDFAFDIPLGVMFVRARFSGNESQPVTVEAFLQEVTTV